MSVMAMYIKDAILAFDVYFTIHISMYLNVNLTISNTTFNHIFNRHWHVYIEQGCDCIPIKVS